MGLLGVPEPINARGIRCEGVVAGETCRVSWIPTASRRLGLGGSLTYS
jgi:hypothetical protein